MPIDPARCKWGQAEVPSGPVSPDRHWAAGAIVTKAREGAGQLDQRFRSERSKRVRYTVAGHERHAPSLAFYESVAVFRLHLRQHRPKLSAHIAGPFAFPVEVESPAVSGADGWSRFLISETFS